MAAKKKGAAAVTVAPEPKSITRTPSGIEIAYWAEPKRFYKLRQAVPTSPLPDGEQGASWLDVPEVPSVTTVLKCLDKPALPWWGMRVGIAGVLKLLEGGYLAYDAEGRLLATVDAVWEYATPELVELLLKQQKLTTNHVVEKAADRGLAAHGAFEAWAAVGAVPDPSEYPPEEHGYLVALRQFVDDVGDAFVTEGVEVAVGSAAHGFAGRYDLRGTFTKDTRLIARSLTKNGSGPLVKGPQYTTVPAGSKVLIDLKTSKSIYSTHLLQLEAYEGAGVECGYEATSARAVLHVSAHGTYQFKQAKATYADFLAILHTYHAVARVEEVL